MCPPPPAPVYAPATTLQTYILRRVPIYPQEGHGGVTRVPEFFDLCQLSSPWVWTNKSQCKSPCKALKQEYWPNRSIYHIFLTFATFGRIKNNFFKKTDTLIKFDVHCTRVGMWKMIKYCNTGHFFHVFKMLAMVRLWAIAVLRVSDNHLNFVAHALTFVHLSYSPNDFLDLEMAIYNLHIFDRNGTCLFYMEWNRKKTAGISREEVNKI